MKLSDLIFFILLIFISSDNYEVLIASSNGYNNYRHQADVYHHYHILIDKGINPDNIIVFAYDDIAFNPKNPFPGKIFNSPLGIDVYEGVIIDYFGEDVTPENFLAAIKGDMESLNINDNRTTSKILTSTKNDNVYIYFSDHGEDNIITFSDNFLYADELINALIIMNEKRMYNKLIFNLEACYSGSIFKNKLPTNISAYAITSANETEVSYAEYCKNKINDTSIGQCLGDEYSCRFMEDIESLDIKNLQEYTFQEQYEKLVKSVEGSHVMQYGDVNVAKNSIADFISSQTKKFLKFFSKSINLINLILPPVIFLDDKINLKIDNENYNIEILRMRVEENNDVEDEIKYYEEISQEMRVSKIFEKFNNYFNLSQRNYDDKIDYDCYREVVNIYKEKCGLSIDRDFKFMKYIANFCTQNIFLNEAEIAFTKICG